MALCVGLACAPRAGSWYDYCTLPMGSMGRIEEKNDANQHTITGQRAYYTYDCCYVRTYGIYPNRSFPRWIHNRIMPILGGATFLQTFKAYKFCWLSGRVGGGKTSLAFYLAGSLFNEGRVNNIVSNIPSVISTFPHPEMPAKDSVLIVDEGGLYLKFSRDFETIAAMLRKMNNYVILPSFIPPAREFRYLTVQREANLGRIIPLPVNIWIYTWRLRMGNVEETGWFAWSNPECVFGLYDSDAAPADDAGVTPWVEAYTKKRMVSYNDYYSGKDKGKGSVKDTHEVRAGSDGSQRLVHSEVTNSIRDASEAMLDGALEISRAAKDLSKRRR